jgi:hypothetical protein
VVVEAFRIEGVQGLIGGGVELRGEGCSQVVSGEFAEEQRAVPGWYLVRVAGVLQCRPAVDGLDWLPDGPALVGCSDCARLRAALVGLVGTDDPEELGLRLAGDKFPGDLSLRRAVEVLLAVRAKS